MILTDEIDLLDPCLPPHAFELRTPESRGEKDGIRSIYSVQMPPHLLLARSKSAHSLIWVVYRICGFGGGGINFQYSDWMEFRIWIGVRRCSQSSFSAWCTGCIVHRVYGAQSTGSLSNQQLYARLLFYSIHVGIIFPI